jgi:chorismate dehydratase
MVPTSNQPMMEKRICLQQELFYRPMTYGLEQKQFQHHFTKAYGNESQAAYKLKEGEVDLSIISAIDYAQKKESWRIVPEIAVAFKENSNILLLFFRKDLKEINTVAVDPSAATAIVLLKIILQEKYNFAPEYIPMQPDIDRMLSQADAALLVGNTALCERRVNRLDLSEEWLDLTGLPFVYGFWAGLDVAAGRAEIALIKKSFELGMKNLTTIAKTFAKQYNDNWGYYHDILTTNIYYRLNEIEKQSLREFYNYAFYYGYSDFIPDLLFFEV